MSACKAFCTDNDNNGHIYMKSANTSNFFMQLIPKMITKESLHIIKQYQMHHSKNS